MYSTSTYTGVNNSLDQIRIFLLADGWTINSFVDDGSHYSFINDGDTFTGKRLHVSKTINGTPVFINMRSAWDQGVLKGSSTGGDPVNGICINGSTAYDGGDAWDLQENACTNPAYPDNSSGGNIDGILSGTGSFHFFLVTHIGHIDV